MFAQEEFGSSPIHLVNGPDGLTLKLGPRVRDTAWGRWFGAIQQALRATSGALCVDLTDCQWMDPTPALSLIVTLAEYQYRGDIRVLFFDPGQITDQASGSRKLQFLKFAATSGLLAALSGSTMQFVAEATALAPSFSRTILIGRRPLTAELIGEFSELPVELAFERSSCIPMQTLLIAETRDGASADVLDAIDAWVESSLLESLEPVISSLVPSWEQPNLRYRIVFALRELLHNISEHAYDGAGLAAVYVRFREGALGEAPSVWQRLARFAEEEARPSNSPLFATRRKLDLFPFKRPGFFEVFVVDAGRGLCESIGERGSDGRVRVNKAMREVFVRSRGRRPERPTELGGLYLLKELMGEASDYLRLYDADAWWGTELPLPDHIRGTETTSQLCVNARLPNSRLAPITGVAWTLRLSWPERADSADSANWVGLDDLGERRFRDQLLDLLRDAAPFRWSSNFSVVDYRFDAANPRILRSDEAASVTTLILPGKRWMKNRVQHEIKEWALSFKSKHLVVGDVPSEEARIYLAAIAASPQFGRPPLREIESVTLVTQDLRACHLTRSGPDDRILPSRDAGIAFMKAFASSASEREAVSGLSDYFRALRKLDSRIFWSIASTRGRFYLEQPVLWTRNITLDGYLDFAQSLTHPVCRSLYSISLQRLAGLFPRHSVTFVALDGMVESLVIPFNSQNPPRVRGGLRASSRPSTDNVRPWIGSVKVTGGTEEDATALSDERGPLFFHFFGHPSGLARGRFLLHWGSIERETARAQAQTVEFARIGRTPAIARWGWKAYRMPRFDQNARSIYEQAPRDSYRFWQEPTKSPLKVGHWFYGGHHELLTINLRLAFEAESAGVGGVPNGPLARFIYRNLISLFGLSLGDFASTGAEVYLRTMAPPYTRHVLKRASALVYMSHAVTDRVIDSFLRLLSSDRGSKAASSLDEVRERVIGLTPIRRHRRGSGLQVSGLMLERLRELAGDGKPAVIFDDALVTGRTYSDLKGLLKEVGFKEIHSLAIVDRQRLPSAKHMDGQKRICYWRLDLPTLGEGHTCPICTARTRAQELAESLASEEHKSLVRKWALMWRPLNPVAEWGDGGLRPIPIRLANRFRKFGIEPDESQPGQFVQIGGPDARVNLTNSAGIASYVAELHCITSRDDLAMRVINENSVTPEARIQILSVQLMLFRGEFDTTLALEMGLALMEAIWKTERSDRTSALGFLTLLACGPSFVRNTVGHFFANTARQQVISSRLPEILMLLAFAMRTRAAGQDDELAWLDDLVALQGVVGPRGKLEVLEWWHRLVRDGAGRAHSTSLHRFLGMSDPDAISVEFVADVRSCVARLKTLAPLIQPYWLLRSHRTPAGAEYAVKVVQQCSSLESELSLLAREGVSSRDAGRALTRAQKIGKQVLAFATSLHEALYCPIGLTELRREAAGQESQVLSRLRKFLSGERAMQILGSNERIAVEFYLPSPAEISEQLACLDKPGASEVFCLWDANIEEAILDVVGNRRHAERDIVCPWLHGSSATAAMWVRVRLADLHLEIDFANQARDATTVAAGLMGRPSPISAFLLESGGMIRYASVTPGVLVATVSLPYAHTLSAIRARSD